MKDRPNAAIVMGGSAGSLQALSEILPALPADYSLPVMVVVHLPPDRPSALLEVFQNKCALSVREAGDKEPIERGVIYFAPPDYHLLVEQGHRLALSSDEPQMFSRPSIDVLFESAADVYGSGLVGIVLSGANEDGAEGLRHVETEGGIALVQAPDTAYAPTMPRAAAGRCRDARVLEPQHMATFLKSLCGYENS